jgi:hypothetical protein
MSWNFSELNSAIDVIEVLSLAESEILKLHPSFE